MYFVIRRACMYIEVRKNKSIYLKESSWVNGKVKSKSTYLGMNRETAYRKLEILVPDYIERQALADYLPYSEHPITTATKKDSKLLKKLATKYTDEVICEIFFDAARKLEKIGKERNQYTVLCANCQHFIPAKQAVTHGYCAVWKNTLYDQDKLLEHHQRKGIEHIVDDPCFLYKMKVKSN